MVLPIPGGQVEKKKKGKKGGNQVLEPTPEIKDQVEPEEPITAPAPVEMIATHSSDFLAGAPTSPGHRVPSRAASPIPRGPSRAPSPIPDTRSRAPSPVFPELVKAEDTAPLPSVVPSLPAVDDSHFTVTSGKAKKKKGKRERAGRRTSSTTVACAVLPP